ncbi:MAG: hypothetical protein ACFE0J_02805 [Elainellaceae cyanobacterium]
MQLSIQTIFNSAIFNSAIFDSAIALRVVIPSQGVGGCGFTSSQADTQNAVDILYVLGYAERFEWSRAIAIPDGGITIQRDQGDILRYLQRDRLVE